MQRYKISLLLAVVGGGAGANAVGLAASRRQPHRSEKPNADVVRVGKRLRCKCGCGDTVATCSMLQCEYSKPGKERIAKMQALGMSDEQIIKAFVQDYGADILLSPPSRFRLDRALCRGGLGLGGDLAVRAKISQAQAAGRGRHHRDRRSGAGEI